MGKVENSRDEKIAASASQDDWNEVSKLLNQPFANSERQGRKYGLIHLDYKIELDGSETELFEIIPNGEKSPEQLFLEKEEQEERDKVINSLPAKQRIIYKAYQKFMVENNNKENFSKFTKQFSKEHWKITDKPLKKTVREARALLKPYQESDFI